MRWTPCLPRNELFQDQEEERRRPGLSKVFYTRTLTADAALQAARLADALGQREEGVESMVKQDQCAVSTAVVDGQTGTVDRL